MRTNTALRNVELSAIHGGVGPERLAVSELIAALSFALDLTEGHTGGHALRSCAIGMRIAGAIHLPRETSADLYYALLLKDVGCGGDSLAIEVEAERSSLGALSSKLNQKVQQWIQIFSHAQLDAERCAASGGSTRSLRCGQLLTEEGLCFSRGLGARIASDLGLSEQVAQAIYSAGEHWDGSGVPGGLCGQQIPITGQIVHIAGSLDTFAHRFGEDVAIEMIHKRSGTWFDPAMVVTATLLHESKQLWKDLDAPGLRLKVLALEPERRTLAVDSSRIDNICLAFAEVADARSCFTLQHSTGVAELAAQMARHMGLDQRSIKTLRRAALVHDIGKLSVPRSILEKPGKLTAEEWRCIQNHPLYTYEILSRISGFEEIADIAASHHEKLDGSGYYRGLAGEELCLLTRILTVADMYDALSHVRLYRGELSAEQVIGVLRRDVPHALDAECVNTLIEVLPERPDGGWRAAEGVALSASADP